MITRENDSAEASPDLAKLRADVLRRQSTGSTEEKSRRHTSDEDDFQFGDSGLNLSRILALLALAVIGIALMVPGSAAVLVAGWGILLIFSVHHIIQVRKKKAAIDNSIRGLFSPLPVSTSLWGVVIPLVTALAVFASLTRNGVEQGAISRWLFICVLALICCSVLAYSLTKKIAKPKFLGILNGFTIGGALAIFSLFAGISALNGLTESSLVLILAGLILFYCGGLAKALLLKVDRKKALSVFSWACVGSLIACALGIGPELRGFAVSLGEKLAVSKDQQQVDFGYQILKNINAAPELEIAGDVYNYHPLSVAEAFKHVDAADAQKMLFFITGKSHINPESTYKAYQDVSDTTPHKVIGLSLAESKMSGHVDANSLTSVMYWTMVFGNQSAQNQEAQAKIALPSGATVSRVTLWINGIPQEAAFNSTEKVTEAYEWITKRNRDPLLITETAPGVINMQAFPVPKFGEMKVRIGITAALNAKSKRDFSFTAPHIISSNFGLSDAATDVKLESNAPITSNGEDSNSTVRNATYVYTAQLAPGNSKTYQFTAHRKTDFTGFSARATHSKEDMVISERLQNFTDDVRKLAVVIDGSNAIGSKRQEIVRALGAIPKSVQTKVMVADHRDAVETFSVAEAINRLNNMEYGGGCDDTNALLAAKKHIGRNAHGAIVWIHGPQPVVFQNDQEPLQGLMKRGEHRLKIYEYQIDAGQSNELKNYLTNLDRSASPEFRTISEEDSAEKDLTKFFNSSLARGADFAIVREKVPNTHSTFTSYDFPVASRLSTIWAADEARKCAGLGDSETAVLLGTAYRVVTPVTGAVVLEMQSDYQYQNLHRNFYSVVSAKAHAASGTVDGTSTVDARQMSPASINDEFALMTSLAPKASAAPMERASRAARAPLLQGATNGTVGPQGQDAFAAPSLQGATSGTLIPMARDAASSAPMLSGLTNGLIGPQGQDATFVTGVNTSASVRVNQLANLEALLNIVANGIEILGIMFGGFYLISGFFMKNTEQQIINKLILGSTALMIGLVTPGLINWLVATAREMNLFS